MRRSARALTAAASIALGLTAVGAGPARAAATDPSVLRCGATSYEVTGFGRGQVLHVVGGLNQFVVTFAQLADTGRVVFNNPGLSDVQDLVTCTATSPDTGRAFIFRGFFTPRV